MKVLYQWKQWNGSSVQLWEVRVPGFLFLNTSDLGHQHNQCECQSVTRRDISQVNIEHFYLPFGHKDSLKLIPNF